MNQPYYEHSTGTGSSATHIIHNDQETQDDNVLNELAETDSPKPAGTSMIPDAQNFTDYYGLSANPFADSVNPEFFYRTVSHDETYIMMSLAIRNHLSIGLVTGPSGTGKTMISQLILTNMANEEIHPVLVLVSPGMSKTALMKDILTELNIPVPDSRFTSTQDLLKLLSDHVIMLHRQNKKLVIIVDECHFLSSDSLHMIRTLTNIEVPERKLITCLLFGEQRFVKRLNHPSHESLRNRMYMRAELGALSLNETEDYIKYRLLKSGRMDDLFDRAALEALHEGSGGICRNINKLAMLSLLEGSLRREPLINEEIVRQCITRM